MGAIIIASKHASACKLPQTVTFATALGKNDLVEVLLFKSIMRLSVVGKVGNGNRAVQQ